MMHATAQMCATDAGISQAKLAEIDALAVVNTVGPSLMDNPPAHLAHRLGAKSATQFLTITGGNTPQMLVNHFAEEIAQGHFSMVLLSGAEALDSLSKSAKAGQSLAWEDHSDLGQPNYLSQELPGSNETEARHGMVAPIVTYPLFENALRRHYARSLSEHQLAIGNMFAPFSTVARDNPHAWFPTERSAEEIATPTPINRYVGFPYTKYMNAVMQVNQSASVLLTSDVRAREMGIDESRWVYLHGRCDIQDIWHVTERINFHSSPALELGLTEMLNASGTGVDEISHFDIYSCFPAVVEITCDALGIATDNGRPLTVTGGLPYFGGAGNNYSMHAIASMMDRLRDNPGEFGLVTANGWYLTKHALGLYSTAVPAKPLAPNASTVLKKKISALSHPHFDPKAEGPGTIETYTVMFDRTGKPETGLVLGHLDDGRRFVAALPSEAKLLEQMLTEDPIGQQGKVRCSEPANHFVFSS
tara:strand:+ start:124 stop:1548 length:1425 start_codon:yes stop_codon:yes gene_type:complete